MRCCDCRECRLLKPNLFIVGAPRCGTTAWVHYLQSHPDIFFPEVKELHYFSPDLPPTQRHIETLDDYLRLFENAGSAKIVGEASVRSLYSKVAARNIHSFNPDAKIIIFVRDQAEYLRSRHSEMLYAGLEELDDFESAWRESVAGPRQSLSGRCANPALLDYASWGRFFEQSERFFAHFSDEQVRVFSFSSWVAAPRATYLEILRFLAVEDDGRTEFPVVNERREPRSSFLMDFLRSPPKPLKAVVAKLKKVTGRRGLGLGNLLLRLNSRSGGGSDIGEELRDEVRRYYAGENDRLEPRIWRPEKSERRSPEPEVANGKA